MVVAYIFVPIIKVLPSAGINPAALKSPLTSRNPSMILSLNEYPRKNHLNTRIDDSEATKWPINTHLFLILYYYIDF